MCVKLGRVYGHGSPRTTCGASSPVLSRNLTLVQTRLGLSGFQLSSLVHYRVTGLPVVHSCEALYLVVIGLHKHGVLYGHSSPLSTHGVHPCFEQGAGPCGVLNERGWGSYYFGS